VQPPDLVELFIGPLESAAATYMITGGVASVVYGDPRFTRDIDVVLKPQAQTPGLISAAFDEADFYVPPPEILQAESGKGLGGHFNVIHLESGLKADFYIAGTDPLHEWALERRRRLQLPSLAIWLAPPEYVIVRKLQYCRDAGSDRHLRDVAEMLRVSAESIAIGDIELWVTRMGLHREWARVRPSSQEPSRPAS
jgi:hypothetical protein